MIANGRTPKNKVEPQLQRRPPDKQNGKGEMEGTEDLTVSRVKNYSAAVTEKTQNSLDNKNVRRVSPLRAITHAKLSAHRWKRFAKQRADITTCNDIEKARIDFPRLREREKMKLNVNRMNAAQLSDLEELVEMTQTGKRAAGDDVEAVNSPSRALLYYFAKLAASSKEEEVIDLEFVDMLIQRGASAAVADQHGQAIIHEAARQWEISVVKLLLQRGADVNQADKYGRTPLHVAAAVDYPDMVQFLIEHGADVHSKTAGELQTPAHFAARNDAVSSLKMLLKFDAKMDDIDYKQRTPLQVAAELDRSETAKYLVRTGADAEAVDDCGMTALVHMISKMPIVAKEALNQFYTTDRANRKQYYYLNNLEPAVPTCMSSGNAKTALEVVVQLKQFDLIMHPVFQRLITVKWDYFGRRGAWFQAFVSFLFVIVWTVLGVTLPREAKEFYSPLETASWRLALGVLGVLMTFNEIKRELAEYLSSRREFGRWTKWREKELERDLEYCHPRWPGERRFLMQEMDSLHHQSQTYFKDAWNIFDWLAYSMIVATVSSHLIAWFTNNSMATEVHINIFSATLIVIWIRLLKTARAFTALGPFVVMLGHVSRDVLKFCFLFFVFYIPYAASFWMVFGQRDIKGYHKAEDLLFSMFRMTVVDDYNYDGLVSADPFMSKILCGTYITFSAIICLNLFIALMSDTFQRVYDNVKANAVMQQASTILHLENNLAPAERRRFTNFIHKKCCPEEMYYDDDLLEGGEEGDLQRMTHQIKEEVDQIHVLLNEQKNAVTTEQNKQEMTGNSQANVLQLRQDFERLEKQQRALTAQFHTQVGEVKDMLHDVIRGLNRLASTKNAPANEAKVSERGNYR